MAEEYGLGDKDIRNNESPSAERGLWIDFALRRAALSVPGNLAEGFGRKHTKDKLNFYYASRGSLAETKSHLMYGEKVGYFKRPDRDQISRVIDDTWRELNALISSLQNRIGS